MARNRSWNPATVILGIALLLPLGSCKKSDDVAPTPQEITINFEVIDHMTGVVGMTFAKNGFAGTPMTITTAETEIAGVVSGYIAVQDLSTGKILASGTNGSTSFSTGTSTSYRVIRFHDGPGMKEVYDEMTRKMGKMHVKRTSTWGRKDDTGATGSESVWTWVFSTANNVLQNPFWLGSMTTGGNENWYGFKKGENGVDVSQRWIYVDSTESEGNQMRSAIGDELPEYAAEFNNLFDKATQLTFCKWQSFELSDKGVAGFRFAFAMLKD